jgi:outer membrane protein assembly factor BamB
MMVKNKNNGKTRGLNCLLLILLLAGLAVVPGLADANGGGLADTPWPMFQHDLQHTGCSPYVGPQTSNLVWTFTVDAGHPNSAVMASDGTLYVCAWNGGQRLYAINPNGSEKWSNPTWHSMNSTPAVGSDGTIYVVQADDLAAYYPDHTHKWSYAVGEFIYSHPAIGPDGTIYFTADDKLYAIKDNGSSAGHIWIKTVPGTFTASSPAIATSGPNSGTIYVGTYNDSLLYAFTSAGVQKWVYDIGSHLYDTSPAIGADGTIYINSGNGDLVAITDTGSAGVEKWEFNVAGGRCQASPAIGSDGTIYIGNNTASPNSRFWAITDNGTDAIGKWVRPDLGPTDASAVIGADDTVYYQNRDGMFYALNGINGSTKWSYNLGTSGITAAAIGANGYVYVGTWNSKLYAFGPPLPSNVYVDIGRPNDNGDGLSWATAKKHIAAGIGAVADNGTVNVAAGTYHEHGLHLSETMNLVGAGALTTIIDGDASGHVLVVSSAPFQRNTISGFTIRNGAPAGSDAGGGIYISQSHIVTINDCAITNNTRDASDGLGGGGICNDGGALYMNRCTVSGNTASAQGGGIFTQKTFGGDSGLVELTDCTISENSVTDSAGQGGGIWNSGTLTIKRCCISSNHSCRGSGIYTMPAAAATLTNCTISGNTGIGVGGGIRNWGIMSCYSVTMSENRGSIGGGFSNDGAPARLYFKNCIVAGNTATSAGNNGYDTNSGAGIESGGNNIDSENSCYFNKPTDQINANPLLGPLQNNGGPTSTHAIRVGSPPYNQGTSVGAPPETDQRGVTRPQAGGYDIGAFELVPTAPTVSTTTASPIGTTTATLLGTLTNNGTASSINLSFEYGPTVSYGSTAPGVPYTTSTAPHSFSAGISGLTANTLYHYRAVAVGDGTANGTDMYFTTMPPPGPQFAGIGTGSNPGGSSGSMSSSISTTQPVVNATIIIQSASISRSRTSGEPVTISATVSNSSTVNGITKVRLYINGQLDSEQAVAVASGKQEPVNFTVSRSEPGTYQVYVNGTSAGSFTVSDNSTILYVSIACLFLALVLGVILIYRRFTV